MFLTGSWTVCETNWKSYAELVGLLAIIASLVFVGMELRQSRFIAIAEMSASSLSNIIEGRNAIIANAEIWAAGNANEDLSPVDEVTYSQLVGIANDTFYYSIWQYEQLGLDEYVELDVAEFAGFLYNNPKALRLWREREQRLAKNLGAIRPDERVTSSWTGRVESALAKFERKLGHADRSGPPAIGRFWPIAAPQISPPPHG